LSKWRKWNNILHRDIGYLVFAMTLIYGVSGIAVNHTGDWNPNFSQEKEILSIEPVAGEDAAEIRQLVMERLGLREVPRSAFRPDPETIQLFYPGRTYSVDLPTGQVVVENVRTRPVLFEVNQLHLNAPKKAWTWIADLYALSLIVVAITGLFVLKGRKGITGRGAWLTLLGTLLPVGYWIWYQYF
jgi:hypothetical protein